MVDSPPNTYRMCLKLVDCLTDVQLPLTVEGVVKRVRIIGWHYVTTAPFFQVRFDGGLNTFSLTQGEALLSDCVQLPTDIDGTVLTQTERGIPVSHTRDLRTRFRVTLYDDSTPPQLMTPKSPMIIWLEIDVI